jgi:tetratricopeptide (TPR) repeat protein
MATQHVRNAEGQCSSFRPPLPDLRRRGHGVGVAAWMSLASLAGAYVLPELADAATPGAVAAPTAAAPAPPVPVAAAPSAIAMAAHDPPAEECGAALESDPYLPSLNDVAALLNACKSDGWAAFGRGVGLLARGDTAAAESALVAAHELLRDSPYPLYYLADLSLRRGDYARAQVTLSEALALRPEFAGAHSLMGAVQLAAGDKNKGLGSLRMAIALAPGRAPAHLELGKAYLAGGEPEHARIALSRALELDAHCHEARYLLGRAHLNAGDLRGGCEVLAAYVRDAAVVPGEAERVSRARAILRRFATES